MASDDKRRLVRAYIEQLWARHDRSRALALLAPGYIDHNPPPGMRADREGLLQMLDIFARALPDAELTLEAIIVEGDLAADRWSLRGVLHEPFFGLGEPGQGLSLRGMDFHRIADGQIQETWHIEDMPGLMRQLRETAGAAHHMTSGASGAPWL